MAVCIARKGPGKEERGVGGQRKGWAAENGWRGVGCAGTKGGQGEGRAEERPVLSVREIYASVPSRMERGKHFLCSLTARKHAFVVVLRGSSWRWRNPQSP